VKGRSFAGQYVYVEGWCFFEKETLQRVAAHWLDLELPIAFELGIARPDVAQAFQNEQYTYCGFRIHIFTYSVPDADFTITMFAHLASGSMHSIGKIHLGR
jgi:hypothetical protein